MRQVLLAKARVKGYSKKDGTYVKPHDRQDQPGGQKQLPLAAKVRQPTETDEVLHHHPRQGENGDKVVVNHPSHPSAPSTWHNPKAVATFVPNGDVPASLNGVALTAWKDHPRTNEGWDYIDGVDDNLDEPHFHLPPGKKAASGVIIEEPDGRVWLVAPTNQFGGYEASFPKGTAEPDLSLQANAIKEAFEECGLKVEITGFLGDYERTTSKARMYRARRVGGTPIAMGWESQAVHLVPKGLLYDHLNMWTDHGIAEAIGAGPAPEKPSKHEVFASKQKPLF